MLDTASKNHPHEHSGNSEKREECGQTKDGLDGGNRYRCNGSDEYEDDN
jgi:hypothetical protein